MPLRRLLIANRGEIVARVARTARRMGIATIAVYSDADRDSGHVGACDEAVPIGGEAATDSYLRIDRILAAARASDADAIHPGYGFLSESADFARAVTDAGLLFVGPPADAIAAMGDKARARQRMAAAGIPVTPGYDGDAQDAATFEREADRIGFPIMVKAAAGGGGRGMRLVAEAADLAAAVRAAAAEALKSFGDGRLLLERALVEPRHVEVQVFADAHGAVIHLGERDCSVQRRHQKVVEESPSPAVGRELRAAMGAAAVAVAREIGYVGAGTVEFLLDRAGRFHFMEMNTRLQVEHPITELVTGLDLVEWQLRVARGEPLPLEQSEVHMDGHAIEVRLCAESPADQFRPGSGTVADWAAPATVRCDHALAPGATVPPWYDSMVAKLVARGPTRADCIEQLAAALDRTVLLGLPSNRSFLARVLRHPAFVDGNSVSTAFIAQHFDTPVSRCAAPDATAWALAAWLSVAAAPEAGCTPERWRHWSTGRPLPQPWRLRWQAAATDAVVEQRGRLALERGRAVVERVDGRHEIEGRAAVAGQFHRIQIDGRQVEYRHAWSGQTLWLHLPHEDYAFDCLRRAAGPTSRSDADAAAEVIATLNGRVADVCVAAGDTVAAGDRLVVIEAMKMEHEVRATRAGRIEQIGVRVGEQVTPGQRLVRYAGDGT
jgi:geranyl-CoA carboxylase alpha subunit